MTQFYVKFKQCNRIFHQGHSNHFNQALKLSKIFRKHIFNQFHNLIADLKILKISFIDLVQAWLRQILCSMRPQNLRTFSIWTFKVPPSKTSLIDLVNKRHLNLWEINIIIDSNSKQYIRTSDIIMINSLLIHL